MAFKVGQKVFCIAKNGDWRFTDSKEIGKGPLYGDIVRVIEIDGDDGFLSFAGWPKNLCYNPNYFRPLQETGMSILYGLLKTKDEKELVE